MLVMAGVVLLLCGLAVVVVQVRRGDTDFERLHGESRETRRAVRRAIREGGTDDARIDRLARRSLRSSFRARWARYVSGLLLAVAVTLLITGSHTAMDVLYRVFHVLLWGGLLVLNVVNQRRYDNYRGLRAVTR